MKKTATDWKKSLQLLDHPEGGCFREVYRSKESVSSSCLASRFGDSRTISTSIYFMLESGERSVFHRIKSDETWHFYDGSPLEIHAIDPQGKYQNFLLGLDPERGYMPQVTIPFGNWFSARSLGDYTLVGCTVAPGFDFRDFEMGSRLDLVQQFPQHQKLIETFTN
jgi:hypothetical protein